MKLSFYGAAQNVTGSRHLLEVNGKKILLDCGLFQGRRKDTEEQNRVFGFDPKIIDAVVLSHAHIDHSGALPYLVKLGFTGPIYCTHATRDLCAVMLQDSAHIHEKDAEWLCRKKGLKNCEPLYTVADADKAIAQFRSVAYEVAVPVAAGIKVTFKEAGHILGSTMELWEIDDKETGKQVRFGFSGDIGRKNLPILRDPDQLTDLDYLIMESTYGNRLHDELSEVEDEVADTINQTVERGGKIIVPAFSVGRTQEVLYVIKELIARNKIKPLPIFIDSPLSRRATDVFRLHPECFDTELQDLIQEENDPFCLDCGVTYTESVEQSKALKVFKEPCVIISSSGMCEFGRIRHHIANNVSDERNTLMIVGFMAQNTLGRKLIDGQNPVNIFGEPHELKMEVKIFNAFSGHADQKGLLEFAAKVGNPKKIFLVHGEKEGQEVLKAEMEKLDNLQKSEVLIPAKGEEFTV